MAKKKSKGVIPKRIAGVKVPKKVRKGRFGELLASKTGQAVIAQAILGAGALAAGLKAKDDPKVRGAAKAARHKLTDAGQGAGDVTGAAGSTLAQALSEAARTFVEVLARGDAKPSPAAGKEEANRWTTDYGATEVGARQ